MRADFIWMNGQVIPWDQAKIHVFAHALHYGSSVFEGIRCYQTHNGPAIFRGRDHYQRLLFSCKVLRIPSPYDVERWMAATAEVLRANGQNNAYIRPAIFRGYNTLGVDGRNCPVEAIVASLPTERHLNQESIEQGIDVMVSSWRRTAPDAGTPLAKIGGQYVNIQLIVMEARDNGFAEGIALDVNGYVSEGSSENVFLVYRGVLYTPPVSHSILSGITRNSVLTIAQDMGLTIREITIPREMLYLADEIFLTGTAAEIAPVRSIDRMLVGSGKRGAITEQIQKRFFAITDGSEPDVWNWLTPL
jgi:branched-chain amino acid aminotransferase